MRNELQHRYRMDGDRRSTIFLSLVHGWHMKHYTNTYLKAIRLDHDRVHPLVLRNAVEVLLEIHRQEFEN
jgi:hypothetical protein